MPYNKSQEKLGTLIERALQDEEIQGKANRADLTREFLVLRIKERASKIWETGNHPLELVNRLESERESAKAELSNSIRAYPRPHSSLTVLRLISLALLIVLLGALIVGIVVTFALGWATVLGWVTKPLVVITIGVFIVLFLIVYGTYMFFNREYRQAVNTHSSDVRAKEEKFEARTIPINERLSHAHEMVDDAIIVNGIKPELRSIIDEYLEKSYDISLEISTAPGLAEILNPEYEISTEAKYKIHRLLDTMPGGSIGIAGPRGAGKTTLLWSFCNPSVKEIKGRPALSVMTLAPVEYDARDFILHIFASVCQRVLELRGESREFQRPGQHIIDLQRSFLKSTFIDFISFLSRSMGEGTKYLAYIGLFLITLGLFTAVLVSTFAYSPSNFTEKAPTGTPISPKIVATPSYTVAVTATSPVTFAVTTTPTGTVTSTITPQSVSTVTSLTTGPSVLATFLSALEITPGLFLRWGLLLWILSLLINRVAQSINGLKAEEARRLENERLDEERAMSNERAKLFEAGGDLVSKARDWLAEIRFQQTYSSGWSGAMKFPVGIEGGMEAAISLARNQLSLPEIIDGYRSLLELVSEKYQVIIGIDELDKLESPDKAQRFLNEIKAIFGIEKCFYLISVSENAMSSFERRGLPFRDSFDSAFDTIIYVDYLNLETAQRLLRRRVIGIPVPFLCLCYCMSGGLARDLIRSCRDLFELVRANPKRRKLPQLCDSLIKSDLESKIRAISIAAQDLMPESEVDQFLEKVYKLESRLESTNAWLATCSDLLSNVNQWSSQIAEHEEVSAKREKSIALVEELGTYLYYSVTLLEFFNEDLKPSTLKKAVARGAIDELARARQFLAISPDLARSIITNFRTSYQMGIPELLKKGHDD